MLPPLGKRHARRWACCAVFWKGETMLRKLLIGTSLWLLTASFTLAGPADSSKDLKEMQKQAARLDEETSQGLQHDAVLASLSKDLNIPVATLQAQQKSTNFGFGQLFIANSLAASSGKTFDEIAQQFKSGQGWGEVAKANNVQLGKVVSSLKRANQEMGRMRADQEQANANHGANSGNAQHAASQAGTRGHGGGSPAGQRGRR